MAPPRKCNCGNCLTCKAREWQYRYRLLGPKERGPYNPRVNITGRENIQIAEDVKELEENFPWLKFDWKGERCETIKDDPVSHSRTR